MTSPMQRSRHSDLPEGPGMASGYVTHVEAQRDLWRFLLPYGHLQTAGLRGGGVVDGLQVSGFAGRPDLLVTPGQALDGRGRALAIPPVGGDELRVRLRRVATADVGTEGLAAVGPDGVAVPTEGLSGEHLLVLEWNETRLTLDGETVYRLTPWLRLERPPTAPRDEWVILARVTLGSGADEGHVTALDAGPRRALTSLRDGLTIQRPLATTGPAGRLGVEQAPGTALRGRPDGGLEVSTWDMTASTWRSALSVDSTGTVFAPTLAAETLAANRLSVDGGITADGVTTTGLTTTGLTTTGLTATSARIDGIVSAGGLELESVRMPIIRTGRVGPDEINWQQYGNGTIYVEIDTKAAQFSDTPLYFCTLGGANASFALGSGAISTAWNEGFMVYYRYGVGMDFLGELTVEKAKQDRWYVYWVGILPR